MKRFYCTICKKVRRTRILPKVISGLNPLQPNPKNRIGECNRHLQQGSLQRKWTTTNELQAEGRMNRKDSTITYPKKVMGVR